MASASTKSSVGKRVSGLQAAGGQPVMAVAFGVVLDEARSGGLLDGEKTEHVSFRAPKALVEAARRESGASGMTELGILALAMLARPDPVANFLRERRGALGADHELEY